MENAVVYGSLYLDEYETFEKAVQQIDGIANQLKEKNMKPIAFAFDVIGNENQRVLGESMVERILVYAKEKFPGLKKYLCSFSVNKKIGEKPRYILN